MLSWRRDPDPVTAPQTFEVRLAPMPDAAHPAPGAPPPFTPPSAPPLGEASYDDLLRALATLRWQEDLIALYESRPSNVDCPRPCCAPASEGAQR